MVMEQQSLEEGSKRQFFLWEVTPLHLWMGGCSLALALLVDLLGQLGGNGLFFGMVASVVVAVLIPDLVKPVVIAVRPALLKPVFAELQAKYSGVPATPLAPPPIALKDVPRTVLLAPPVQQEPQESPGTKLLPVFPPYPENETVCMGKVAATGQRFDPHFDGFFGKGFIAAAVQGSGKSMLCGNIIEQAGKCGVPAIVLDHKGEYDPITELSMLNGCRVGATNEFDIMLTPENAYQVVSTMFENRYQMIVHLPSYGDGWIDRARIVAAVGKALMKYASVQRQQGNELLPCLVELDEAQLYIPQNVNLLPPEARRTPEVLEELSNSFFSLVSNGRSNGYTVFFATQSLTYIAKWAIKSSQIRIYMKHAEKNDLDMCEDTIPASVATREMIENFPPGTGVVFGLTPKAMVVTFDKKQSRDESETPNMQRLREPRKRPPLESQQVRQESIIPEQHGWNPQNTVNRSSHPAGRLPALEELQPQYDTLPYAESEARPVHTIAQRVSDRPELTDRQRFALAFWQEREGQTRTHRVLALAMNKAARFGKVSDNEAYQLLIELDEQGLIERPKRKG
jgi:hypothetical protein